MQMEGVYRSLLDIDEAVKTGKSKTSGPGWM
jgi:hypothetical protein